jgi:hypothetical protein
MSNSSHSWRGSEDVQVLSGHATFVVGDLKVEMELPSFIDFHTICKLLEASGRVGAAQARANVGEAVRRALEAA